MLTRQRAGGARPRRAAARRQRDRGPSPSVAPARRAGAARDLPPAAAGARPQDNPWISSRSAAGSRASRSGPWCRAAGRAQARDESLAALGRVNRCRRARRTAGGSGPSPRAGSPRPARDGCFVRHRAAASVGARVGAGAGRALPGPAAAAAPGTLEHSGATSPGDIHWNERGHALVGQWVRDWFREEVRPRGFVADVEP